MCFILTAVAYINELICLVTEKKYYLLFMSLTFYCVTNTVITKQQEVGNTYLRTMHFN